VRVSFYVSKVFVDGECRKGITGVFSGVNDDVAIEYSSE